MEAMLDLNFETVDTPTVQIKRFTAQIKYTVKPTEGAQQLLSYLPGLKRKIDHLGETYSYPRFGFAIVVKNQPVPAPNALRAKMGTISSLSPQAIKTALNDADFLLILPALATGDVDPTQVFTALLQTKLKGVDYTGLPADPVFPYCYDLRGIPVVKTEMDKLADRMKIGNRGQAEVSRLSFNFHTGQVSVAINLRAKAVTSLEAAAEDAGKTRDDVSDATVARFKAVTADLEAARRQVMRGAKGECGER